MTTKALSRSVSVLGTANFGSSPKQNLPVIAHPMSKLDRDNLSVRGQGPISPVQRERTFVGVCDGEVRLGLDRSNLPPLGSAGRDWTGRSLAQEVDTFQTLSGGRMMTSRIINPPDFSPKAARWDAGTGYSVSELIYVIAEKLGTEYHGIKHIFKGNDPTGQGVVSKEALLKIIYTVVGYVSADQFNKLLKTIGLSGKANISFDEFVRCFRETQKPLKVWLSPAQRVEIAKAPKRTDPHYVRSGAVSAAFCYSLLRDRAKAGEYHIKDVLPEACFMTGGRVIPPQLHDMIQYLGYKLSEDEFVKLWKKFDGSDVGTVETSCFIKKLGLDDRGRARPATVRHVIIQPRMENRPKKAIRTQLPRRLPPIIQNIEEKSQAEMEEDDSSLEEDDKDTDLDSGKTSSSPTEEPARKKRFLKKKGNAPQMDQITHCLHYKFEEPYNLLKEGMKCFDFLKDGFIARIDFKKVLEEFNLPISVIDLEYFLSRCGVRVIHGQLIYQDFLMKFFNKAQFSMMHRIVSNNPHMFTGGKTLPPVEKGGSLTAEELEIRLVDYLHQDFLNLMTSFRKCDKYRLGVITKYEFRQCIERLLGYSMSDDQFTEVLGDVKLDKDGLVPYSAFLESFNKPPGSWNRQEVGGHTVVAIRQRGLPPEVVGLKQEADALMSKVRAEVRKDEEENERGLRRSKGMNLHELNACIVQFFKVKFHIFDKAFKNIDRKMTGRCNVHQFVDILKGCGLSLLPAEVEVLWTSLPVSGDNMLAFSALIRHINSLNKGSQHITDKHMKDSSELVENARQLIMEKNERAEREMEQFSSEPIRVEISKINYEQVLEQLRPDVTKHWEKLKTLLRHMDPQGKSLVALGDMKDVFLMFRLPLSPSEMDAMLQLFSCNETNMFNYMDFLKYFTRPKSEVLNSTSFGFSQKLQQKISKEQKNLKRAFKKADLVGSGLLNVDEFRHVLESVGININDEDIFKILSQLDHDMSGQIPYGMFLSQI